MSVQLCTIRPQYNDIPTTYYETFKNVKLFVNPDFTYHQIMSRFAAELLRPLADSVIIPFTAKPYAVRMKQIYEDLRKNVLDDLNKQGLNKSLGRITTSYFSNLFKQLQYPYT